MWTSTSHFHGYCMFQLYLNLESLFMLNNVSLYGHTTSIDSYLGCFYFWASVNNVATTIYVSVFVGGYFSIIFFVLNTRGKLLVSPWLTF